jgi:Domain of unknown function (DUF3291)
MAWEAYAAWAAWHDDVPAGARPATADAEDRIRLLRAHGPTPAAFTLKQHFPPPGAADASPRHAPGDWMCPA